MGKGRSKRRPDSAGGGAKKAREGSSNAPTKEITTKQSSSSLSIFVAVVVAVLAIGVGVQYNRPTHSPNVESFPLNTSLSRKEAEVERVDPPFHTECTEENLSAFLHERPVRGLHVACIGTGYKTEESESTASPGIKLFPGAQVGSERVRFPIGEEKDLTWGGLHRALSEELSLPRSGPQQQPWAIFTPRGERIVGADDRKDPLFSSETEELIIKMLLKSEMVVIFEGGKWLWPGVRVGFERTVDLYSVMPGPPGSFVKADTRNVTIETLSLTPLVVSVKGFLSAEECDHIEKRAGPKMRYSEVSHMDHDVGKPSSDWRTSQNTFLSSRADRILQDLDVRTASLTRLPKNHQEELQVLRYGKTEHYVAHHDFFNPVHYQSDPQTIAMTKNGLRNRFATVFWYLSDVEAGGETIFPRWNGAPQPRDFGDCTKGLKVKPELGKVIIFYSLFADGGMDELSLHGACPVEEGIKWAANKWVWNDRMGYTPD